MGILNMLWQSPAPSSGFLEGVVFQVLPQRACSLTFKYEDSEGAIKPYSLFIRGSEAFKCTYLTSLTAEMIDSSYDKLVDLGESPWLREVKAAGSAVERTKLKHLRICFDDGPCYEFICTGFDVRSSS